MRPLTGASVEGAWPWGGGPAPGVPEHALLTAEAIAARGLRLAGWLGNHIDPAMQRQADNVRYLQTQLQQTFGAPCLGLVPHMPYVLPGDTQGDAERGSTALDALAQSLLPSLCLPWLHAPEVKR